MEISEQKREFNIKFGDIILIGAKIRLPQFGDRTKAAQRMNGYYKALMRLFERYVNRNLTKHAKAQYTFLTKHGFLFHSFQFTVDFTVTLNDGDNVSLYVDRVEYTGGANSITVREGDAWENGFPMKIKTPNKHAILRQITEIVKERQAAGEVFFEPVKRYVRKYYDPGQWYLTPDGVTVFYQEITIAPHVSGIVTFPLSFI